jgi:hypothetical protein
MLKLGEYFDHVPNMTLPFIDESMMKLTLMGSIGLALVAGIVPTAAGALKEKSA